MCIIMARNTYIILCGIFSYQIHKQLLHIPVKERLEVCFVSRKVVNV